MAVSTTNAGRLDLCGFSTHADVMTSTIAHRSHLSVLSLIVIFVGTLLIIATPPGAAAPHRERWQWPTGGPVTVVE